MMIFHMTTTLRWLIEQDLSTLLFQVDFAAEENGFVGR
jgi:hypothetical protein